MVVISASVQTSHDEDFAVRKHARSVPPRKGAMLAVAQRCPRPDVDFGAAKKGEMVGATISDLCDEDVPLASTLAVWIYRAVARLPVALQVPVAGSYTSALVRPPEKPFPATTRTAVCKHACGMIVSSVARLPVVLQNGSISAGYRTDCPLPVSRTPHLLAPGSVTARPRRTGVPVVRAPNELHACFVKAALEPRQTGGAIPRRGVPPASMSSTVLATAE